MNIVLHVCFRLNESVTPLWNVAYEEQLKVCRYVSLCLIAFMR